MLCIIMVMGVTGGRKPTAGAMWPGLGRARGTVRTCNITFPLFACSRTGVGIFQCGSLIPLRMKMGTNLLGVCVREGVMGGWLFVGRRVRALKDIWCGMALARYVNAFIDM